MAFYFGVFKEPRGLIRFLELIFAICAFGTACNGGSSITMVLSSNSSNGTASASWSYPYNLQNKRLILDLNMTQTQRDLSSSNNIKASAEFFVFTGVTSMLLCLAFLVVYVILDRQYRNKEILPLADLVITVLWMIFWLAGSAAWAQGVSNIRSSTSAENVWSRLEELKEEYTYNVTLSPTYTNIIVSVIFGFLNFLLWLGSIWFVYKETRFFRGRNAQSSQPNNFSNIGSPSSFNQQQARPSGPMG